MIISQSGIKRELDKRKPFLLIMSRDEARALVRQLEGNGLTDDGYSYGCVTIYPFDWCDTPSNVPPNKWTD